MQPSLQGLCRWSCSNATYSRAWRSQFRYTGMYGAKCWCSHCALWPLVFGGCTWRSHWSVLQHTDWNWPPAVSSSMFSQLQCHVGESRSVQAVQLVRWSVSASWVEPCLHSPSFRDSPVNKTEKRVAQRNLAFNYGLEKQRERTLIVNLLMKYQGLTVLDVKGSVSAAVMNPNLFPASHATTVKAIHIHELFLALSLTPTRPSPPQVITQFSVSKGLPMTAHDDPWYCDTITASQAVLYRATGNFHEFLAICCHMKWNLAIFSWILGNISQFEFIKNNICYKSSWFLKDSFQMLWFLLQYTDNIVGFDFKLLEFYWASHWYSLKI